MKYFKILAVAACFVILSACSGTSGSSYNIEECKQLEQKIENKETLNEKDFDMMLDQFEAITESISESAKKNGQEAAMDSLSKTPEGKDMLMYYLGFAFYIQEHAKEMTNSQSQRFLKIAEKVNKLKEKEK